MKTEIISISQYTEGGEIVRTYGVFKDGKRLKEFYEEADAKRYKREVDNENKT